MEQQSIQAVKKHRYTHDIERKQIAYLQKRKEALMYGFIDACEEINSQIRAVRSGKWLEELRDGKEASDG